MKRKQNELNDAIEQLKGSIKIYEKNKSDKQLEKYLFDAVLKSFEVTVECYWKKIRYLASEEGIDVFSPRDAIRTGAQMGLINDPEFFMEVVDVRNWSVHGYYSIKKEDIYDLILKFSKQIKKIDY